MLNDGTFVCDIECDSLTPTKIHCIAVQSNEGAFETTNYDDMRKFFTSAKILIMHNGIRFDIPVVEKLLGIKITARLIDTLGLSWTLFPDRSSHGLESWGTSFGIQKPEVTDWADLPVEVYLERCREDVRINTKLWEYILRKLNKLYDNEDDLNAYIDYLSFKMHCAMLQEQNGWKLDQEYARSALQSLVQEQEEKVRVLQRIMPKVAVRASKSRPKHMYKKDGSLSKLGEIWLDRLRELGYDEGVESIEIIEGYEDPNPNSNTQIKDWLFSLGWKPDVFKENDKSKEVPQVNKEPQKGGGLTDSVKRLYDVEPNLEVLDGLSVLNSRIPLLRSFLNNVDHRGKLKAGVAGLTNTLRFRHAGLVNLPRVDRLYSEAVRGSLVAEDGTILVGSDMSSLEDKLKQHFMYPHDPQYVHEMDIPGYDPHLSLAVSAGAVTDDQSNKYKEGVDKSIKPIRDIYKNGNYACQYNAYPTTIARTCGVPLSKGKEIFEAYWKKNWSIKKVAAEQTTKTILSNGKEEKWMLKPINHFWYSLRSDNDRFSTLVQGTASYVFDLWLGYVLQVIEEMKSSKWFRLIGQFHDEWIFDIPNDPFSQTKMKEITYDSIDKLNNYLSLNKKLGISIQFNERYSNIH